MYTQKPTSRSVHTEAYTKKLTHRSLKQEAYTQKPTPISIHTEAYTNKCTHRSLHQEAYTQKPTPISVTHMSGAYLQLPVVVLNFGVSASIGTGMPTPISVHTEAYTNKCIHRSRLLTGNDLIVQMTAFMSGAYLQLPVVVLNFGVSASIGTGMMISTLLAVDRLLN